MLGWVSSSSSLIWKGTRKSEKQNIIMHKINKLTKQQDRCHQHLKGGHREKNVEVDLDMHTYDKPQCSSTCCSQPWWECLVVSTSRPRERAICCEVSQKMKCNRLESSPLDSESFRMAEKVLEVNAFVCTATVATLTAKQWSCSTHPNTDQCIMICSLHRVLFKWFESNDRSHPTLCA